MHSALSDGNMEKGKEAVQPTSLILGFSLIYQFILNVVLVLVAYEIIRLQPEVQQLTERASVVSQREQVSARQQVS